MEIFNQIYYLIRAKQDGQYLVAKIDNQQGKNSRYLLVFKEDFEALSYLNAHAQDYSPQFTVESVSNAQLKGIMQRWGFNGMGIVEDYLIPKIKFLG
jgi:hypothetical protein